MGNPGGWAERRQAERPTGPETGSSLSLQVTLVLLKHPLAHKACVLDTVPGSLTSKDRLLDTTSEGRATRAGVSPCGNFVLVFGFGVMCFQGPWWVE